MGFGTWGIRAEDIDRTVRAAIHVGYRLFDLAPLYQNQAQIGATLESLDREGAVQRHELFLTSKVAPTVACSDRELRYDVQRTLTQLRTSYLDLLLVHWPFCVRSDAPTWPPTLEYQLGYSPQQLHATWRTMEALHDSGTARAIGVSNLGVHRLASLLNVARVPPAVVQTELHPYLQSKPLRRLCRARGIVITAYSSLGSVTRPAKCALHARPWSLSCLFLAQG
jgi:diketogulonate reductase-like aldo/keto reductase